jgi:hypothetical protein
LKIYVDADACPVVKIVEQVAMGNNIPVTLLCDTNHVMDSDYSEVKIIGAGAAHQQKVLDGIREEPH